jgi:hypothetical protein
MYVCSTNSSISMSVRNLAGHNIVVVHMGHLVAYGRTWSRVAEGSLNRRESSVPVNRYMINCLDEVSVVRECVRCEARSARRAPTVGSSDSNEVRVPLSKGFSWKGDPTGISPGWSVPGHRRD